MYIFGCSQDCHGGGGHAAPMKDQHQNYELLTGFQNDTHTVVRFSRDWDTCDSQDDLVLTEFDFIQINFVFGGT
ncbi:hypothetical protein WDU94_004189 [Cyamophila willieti]